MFFKACAVKIFNNKLAKHCKALQCHCIFVFLKNIIFTCCLYIRKFFLEPRGNACQTEPSLRINMGAASQTMACKLRWPNQNLLYRTRVKISLQNKPSPPLPLWSNKPNQTYCLKPRGAACRTKPSFSDQEDNQKAKLPIQICKIAEAKILVHEGVYCIVDFGIGLSYRPARLHQLAAATTTLCQSRLYPIVRD